MYFMEVARVEGTCTINDAVQRLKPGLSITIQYKYLDQGWQRKERTIGTNA